MDYQTTTSNTEVGTQFYDEFHQIFMKIMLLNESWEKYRAIFGSKKEYIEIYNLLGGEYWGFVYLAIPNYIKRQRKIQLPVLRSLFN